MIEDIGLPLFIASFTLKKLMIVEATCYELIVILGIPDIHFAQLNISKIINNNRNVNKLPNRIFQDLKI